MDQKLHADIVVVGAGPGGLSAAITAARQGMDVLLVERLGYLGGCLAMGLPLLGYYDAQERFVSGGFAQELVSRLQEIGGATTHRICPMHNSTTLIDPSIAKILCFQMAQEAGVRLLLHCELVDVLLTASSNHLIVLLKINTNLSQLKDMPKQINLSKWAGQLVILLIPVMMVIC